MGRISRDLLKLLRSGWNSGALELMGPHDRIDFGRALLFGNMKMKANGEYLVAIGNGDGS